MARNEQSILVHDHCAIAQEVVRLSCFLIAREELRIDRLSKGVSDDMEVKDLVVQVVVYEPIT